MIKFIFHEECMACSIFEENKPTIDFFIKSLDLQLLDPEYPLIN